MKHPRPTRLRCLWLVTAACASFAAGALAADTRPAARPKKAPAAPAAPASMPAPAPVVAPEPPPPPPPPLIAAGAIDAALRGLVDSQQIVGTSALIYERGKEAYFGAFGFADRENNVPMARDSIVQIFSMTKPVTGVALMMLYERGKFGLDDPLARYLPEFASAKVYVGQDASGRPLLEAPRRPILVRDILRHTAGFSEGEGDQTAVGAIYRQIDPRRLENALPELCAKLAQVPLAYQPGTRWLYSDAVDVQACLVQKLSGVPFDRFLELHLFKPLGMASTRHTILPTDPDRPRLAALYARNADTFTRIPDAEAYGFVGTAWPQKPGAFGLVSTLDDYMKFARMLLGGGKLGRVRILKPETVRLMSTDSMPPEVTDKSWLPGKGQMGFGIDFAVRIAPPKDAQELSGAVGEFFWDGKANTLFWVDPKNDIAAVLFTQYFPPGARPLHKDFRDAVYRNDPVALAH